MTTKEFQTLHDHIAIILCHLEKIFMSSLFDIKEHLPIHLAEEAIIAGPVQYRWMYPIERFLLTLKLYVRNRAHPEGSIAEGYLVEECMNFCGRYLEDVKTMSNRPIRNYDGNNKSGRGLGSGKQFLLDDITWAQAHWYVLMNFNAITSFREDMFDVLAKEHMTEPQVEPYNGQHLDDNIFTNDEDSAWVMRVVDGATVDVNIVEDDDVDTESDDD
ncbi:hypothetical protein F0562_007449 [Nyssa sinensis]|uniref:DUF4218 domain-containing protein n=1 Tax=Nyssa sinensis TaxID=561372 RepID=A0A5J5A5W6_9ASTE|nr:hypothetical protein F0562_007449 [Nyssa sinensis]